MSFQSERRRHKRIPVKIPATIYFKDKPTEGKPAEILDLSLGGAFVHCTIPIKIGEEILLEVRFNETQLLDAKVVITVRKEKTETKKNSEITEQAVVRWARGSSNSGFGVEFTNLPGDKQAFLDKLLQYFENLKKSGVHLPNR